jgi:hypothetical protein
VPAPSSPFKDQYQTTETKEDLKVSLSTVDVDLEKASRINSMKFNEQASHRAHSSLPHQIPFSQKGIHKQYQSQNLLLSKLGPVVPKQP